MAAQRVLNKRPGIYSLQTRTTTFQDQEKLLENVNGG